MNIELVFNGMVKGMEMMGAKFVELKTDRTVLFDIPAGSEIDDGPSLLRAKDGFKDIGLILKIKRV